MDYDGREDQVIDPLIGSIEGLSNTPAYRGLALAVFENLELADYGNRIPFLTFEVLADASPPTLSDILSDASGGHIHSSDATPVIGYAALGNTIAASVTPLVECFGVPLFDDGTALRSPMEAPPAEPQTEDLGATFSGQAASRFEREQTAASDLPAALSLTFYEPSRDYQTSLVRTAAGEEAGNDAPLELPAVLNATDARSLVERIIARKWALRDELTLRLPPRFMTLEPGAMVTLDLAPGSWQVQSCTIEGLTVVVKLRPAWNPFAAIEADGGRSNESPDVVAAPVTLAAIEMIDPTGEPSSSPVLLLAASSPGPAWRAIPVEVTAGGFSTAIRSARKKALLGHAMMKLAEGPLESLDLDGSAEVQLLDEDQWLTSCDDDALAAGANLAMLGEELLQFGMAEPLGAGRFRLRRLLRGKLGTEWAVSHHTAGETFVVIDPEALQPVRLPTWTKGSAVSFVEQGETGGKRAWAVREKRTINSPRPHD